MTTSTTNSSINNIPAEKCPACGSCGMPLEKPEHFALNDPSRDVCCYCTDSDGKVFPWEKILEMNAKYYQESQGITQEAATTLAGDFLKTLPVWKAAFATGARS